MTSKTAGERIGEGREVTRSNADDELARLTRENEELRTMFAPQPANKTIDDLARVAFETSWAGFDTGEKWDEQPEEYKENWRRIVLAVLEANARKGAGDAPR